MRLKKLTLHGFKSFADRTELMFDRGMTGIVGPNGCGKSNVVDAFKWVLGEQSAKNIRGRQMTDVIFNGSSSRKSMGMAEVSMSIETDNDFPEEFGAEVVITRRLYRSGQSEYLLNNKPSRLKDIRELLMDTGMGIDTYSFIEQGKVDTLLQASAHERRIVLEEAAGISKYKARKKEAQRRLERVEQNLLRVSDIVAEVEKQLRSVKLQAGKARNYQQYSVRLNELKSQSYLAEYHKLIEDQGNLRVRLDDVNQHLKDLQVKSDLADSNRSKIDLELIDLGNGISSIENHLTQRNGIIESARQKTRMLNQRIVEQTEYLKLSQNRLQSYHSQIAAIGLEQQKLKEQLTVIDKEDEEFSHTIGEIQEQLSSRELELAGMTNAIEEEKSSLIELMRNIAQTNNQINQADIQIGNISAQREKLVQRNGELEEQIKVLRGQEDDYHAEIAGLREKNGIAESSLEGVQQQYKELHEQADSITEKLAEKREKRSALQSRLDVLSDMESRLQGLDSGVKTLLERKETSPDSFTDSINIIADLIQTDLEHAPIVESALSGRDQFLIVDSVEQISTNSKMLAELPGKVNFFALDNLPALVNSRDYTNRDGVVGIASSFIRNEDKYDHLVRVLLGKTIIVSDLATAIALQREDDSGMRFVTLNNELVEADGSIQVGSAKSGSGLISRKSELQDLREKLESLDAEIRILQSQSEETSSRQEELLKEQQQLRARIYEIKTLLVKAKTNLGNCTQQIERIGKEQPIIASEMKSIDEQEKFLSQQKERFSGNIAEYESQQVRIKAIIDEKEASLRDRLAEKQSLANALTEKKILAGQLAEKRRSCSDSLSSLVHRQRELKLTHDSAESEILSAQSRIDHAERQILQTDAQLAQAFLDKQLYQRQSAELRQQRSTRHQMMQEITLESQKIKEQMNSTLTDSQELSIKINELTVRQETTIQRAQEELQIDIEHTYGDYNYEEQDWDAVGAEINELKGKISRLGNVNINAIAEQEGLEARLVFLTSQHSDLTESQKKLYELIEKLDEESRNRFMETFESVRSNFHELFRKLFGGGKAELVLDNAEDVLESGIEILAKPPGKETRSVTLLSGGEKTMTTVALLMAIFKSKPSPFCILDEVDAALDEANIDRFNLVLQDFLQYSQFIAITHNKRTMSYATTMYGITMQETGVSKRVAVRFGNKEGGANETEEHEAA